MLKAKKINATQGPLIPLIISFVIPLILMTLIQKLFNAVDIAVLGNMADTTAVAAVGATGTIISLIVDSFFGISTGAKIVFSRAVGKNDPKELQRTLDSSIVIASVLGIAIAGLGLILSPALLRLVDCPAECFEGAVLYTRIYLLASPVNLIYNFGAAILTSWGDTRRPLYFAIVAGLANVVLNVILCLILPQKVMAVAIATVASQAICAALVIRQLCRTEGAVKLRLRAIRPHAATTAQIFRLGIPVMLVNLIYPLANLQIAAAINSYGVSAVAGNSASQTVEQMLGACRVSFGNASATFIGQNIGAKKPDRVRDSFLHILWIGVVLTLICGTTLVLSAPMWLRIFLEGDPLAMEYALTRVHIMLQFQFISTAVSVFTQAVQAFGYPIFGTLNSVVWILGFRTFWMNVIYPRILTYQNLVACFVVAWVCTLICYIFILGIIYRRYRRKCAAEALPV